MLCPKCAFSYVRKVQLILKSSEWFVGKVRRVKEESHLAECEHFVFT